jgi:hypothetical protein
MQNWGVSTILIESGGWYEDRYDFLQKMNFIALMSVFHAIGNKSYEEANPAIYEAISENDKNIFDLMIKNATVMDGTGNESFRTDIAINYDSEGLGTITDVGDLELFAAKQTIDAGELFLTPGFVTMVDMNSIPLNELTDRLNDKFREGFTTILLKLDHTHLGEIDHIRKKFDDLDVPANMGSIFYIDEQSSSAQDSLRILKYIAKRGLGIIVEKESQSTISYRHYTNKPVRTVPQGSVPESYDSITPEIVKDFTSDICTTWNINKRGTLHRGQIADLILFSQNTDKTFKVHSVFVKGHEIVHQGLRTNAEINGDIWF